MLMPEQFEADVKEFIAECQSHPVIDLSKDDPCEGCRFEDFCDRFIWVMVAHGIGEFMRGVNEWFTLQVIFMVILTVF